MPRLCGCKNRNQLETKGCWRMLKKKHYSLLTTHQSQPLGRFRMGIGSIVPRVNASYLMSCCAIVWSMFLSNVKYKLHSYWPENTALPLLIKVQLNASGLIRLVIMLHDWLAFFRRRRRQVSHLLFSKPILKKKRKKERKQQNQSARSHYLQFSHLTVFELDSFFFLSFCIFSKNLTMYSETPHCTLLRLHR